jgi:hypothetical protein
MESEATLGSVYTSSQWWEIFAIDKAFLSLALTLKMF